MAKNISLFPTLTNAYLEKMRYQPSSYQFFYTNELEENLDTEELNEAGTLFRIDDPEGIWNPDEYDLGLKRKYTFRTVDLLFGEKGIACSNAVIGVALMWTSQDSKQRGVIPIGEIKKDIAEFQFSVKQLFDKGQLRGTVDFETVLYIKESGTPFLGEEMLANRVGTILGTFNDKISVKLDGTGSVFPIFERENPGQPLWSVLCTWEDPASDSFYENVSITINTANRNYKYLNRNDKENYNPQLLEEIMASALTIVILKLKENGGDWDTMISGQEIAQGSVSEAIKYFIETLEWDVSSPERISLSMRKFFDQRMQK